MHRLLAVSMQRFLTNWRQARRHQDREHSPDEMTAFCDYRKVLHDEGRQTVENADEVKDELARLREIFVGR